MTATVPRFALEIPAGFIEIPVGAPDSLNAADVEFVRAQLRAVFDNAVPEDDDGLTMTAAALVAFGLSAAAGDAQLAAVGVMRSPDADRPVLVQLVAAQTATNRASAEAALDDLREAHRNSVHGTSMTELTLPAGAAVHVVKETSNVVHHEGAEVAITQRESAVWLPDPSGRTIAIVMVSSANLADWPHIAALASDIYESIEWDF